jgi:hypothetical protein
MKFSLRCGQLHKEQEKCDKGEALIQLRDRYQIRCRSIEGNCEEVEDCKDCRGENNADDSTCKRLISILDWEEISCASNGSAGNLQSLD